MVKSVFAISVGAILGALLRWWLGGRLNNFFPLVPPGTLAANLIGAYVIGAATAFFASFSAIAPEWRLFVITGFCGALTTFSTFAMEIVSLLQRGNRLMALGSAGVHLTGSILMVVLGMGTVVWLRS